MAENKPQLANVSQFLGLRTDCPPAKCPPTHSPDLADVIMTMGGMETRPPFRRFASLPANCVWFKEFTCKDGSVQVIALDVNGILYKDAFTSPTQIDQVTPGSRATSVTAYGREYIAFFNDQGGSDAPRFWDGKAVQRVSKGGPGAAPTVINYAIPASQLIAGSAGTAIAITTITPSDPEDVQVSGGNDYGQDYYGGGYQPPQYETYYTTLTVVTTTAHGLSVGAVVTLSGNSVWRIGAASVGQIIDANTFKVYYQQQSNTVSNGGTITPSSPLLARLNNEVTAATPGPHQARRGYQVKISDIPDQVIGGSVVSIVIDNDANPGQAKITTSLPSGVSPGQVVTLTGVTDVVVGTKITTITYAGGTSTATLQTAHGLEVGAYVRIIFNNGPRAALCCDFCSLANAD